MTELTLSIVNKDNEIKRTVRKKEETFIYHDMYATGDDQVYLADRNLNYDHGDKIVVTSNEKNCFLMVKLDETLDASLIYLDKQKWEYVISQEEAHLQASPSSRFISGAHYLSVRVATKEEITQYYNLALNSHDQKEFTGAYPHASANVETRNDATFFACNAIDGIYANHSHGSYPFQSWGINQQKDASLKIDFGRSVEVDQVVFTFRADFPHDNYWKEVTLYFSDGSKETFATKKTGQRQVFCFEKRQISYVIFTDLKQAMDPSPFPALTQIEIFGKNIL